MDDLISKRSATERLIIAKTLLESILQDMPTAEPSGELIRCRECKHNYVDGDNVRFNVCELMHNKMQSDDWYCADAERRSDG